MHIHILYNKGYYRTDCRKTFYFVIIIANYLKPPQLSSAITFNILSIILLDYLDEEIYDGDLVYESIYEDIPQDTSQVKVTTRQLL